MFSARRKIVFKVIEYFFYLALFAIAIVFTREVFEKFQSEATSFLQKEENIVENPTITFCFQLDSNSIQFGKDLNITMGVKKGYDIIKTSSMLLNEGITHYRGNTEEILLLEKIILEDVFTCYKITPKFLQLGVWVYHIVYFDSATFIGKLPAVRVYVTSENNSYGIIKENWSDGEQLSYTLKVGSKPKKKVRIHPEKINNLGTKTKCRNEPYYECYAKHLINKVDFKNCKKCIFQTLPPDSIMNATICATEEEIQCARDIENRAWWNLSLEECPRPCTILQYKEKSEVAYEDTNQSDDLKVSFYYMLAAVDKVTVYEEYIIYDFIGMIGSAGGTLGLFIGFSFMNVIDVMLQLVKNMFND